MDPIPIPAVTIAQMKEVDRLMVDEYHVALVMMMENGGRALARLAKRMLDGSVADRSLVVMAGKGSNGGGGLVAARHLLNWGAWVQVVLSDSSESYSGLPAQQLAALRAAGAAIAWAEEGWELPPADLVIDALVGYGLRGAPRAGVRALVQLANSSAAPILSLDIPTGIDGDTGRCYTPHVRAAATLTLALPKVGMLKSPARSACGRLFVADIGVPPALYAALGIGMDPIFGHDPVLELQVRDGQAWLDPESAVP